jgi:hypothetical protein
VGPRGRVVTSQVCSDPHLHVGHIPEVIADEATTAITEMHAATSSHAA